MLRTDWSETYLTQSLVHHQEGQIARQKRCVHRTSLQNFRPVTLYQIPVTRLSIGVFNIRGVSVTRSFVWQMRGISYERLPCVCTVLIFPLASRFLVRSLSSFQASPRPRIRASEAWHDALYHEYLKGHRLSIKSIPYPILFPIHSNFKKIGTASAQAVQGTKFHQLFSPLNGRHVSPWEVE